MSEPIRPVASSFWDFVTEYDESVSVAAMHFDGDNGHSITVTHSGCGDCSASLIGLTVRDAHALAVALYTVIADLDQKVGV